MNRPTSAMATAAELRATGLAHRWDSGPFGERARALVNANRTWVDRLFKHITRLSERLSLDTDAWVVSHGEPHSGNAVHSHSGDLRLIDWDTVRLAPRERDLVELLDPVARSAYTSVAGDFNLRPYVLELFRAEWDLQEIDCYVSKLYRQHSGSGDAREAISELATYLNISDRWPNIP